MALAKASSGTALALLWQALAVLWRARLLTVCRLLSTVRRAGPSERRDGRPPGIFLYVLINPGLKSRNQLREPKASHHRIIRNSYRDVFSVFKVCSKLVRRAGTAQGALQFCNLRV